ncbi:hypothetical protein GCM10020254_22100 [Streptomyces goshikiensis]
MLLYAHFSPGAKSALCSKARSEEVAGFEVPPPEGVVVDTGLIVGKSAGVLEELTDLDAATVDPLPAHEAGQVRVDRGVEVDLSLADQLQHDHRGERLGGAADPHLAVLRHLRAGGHIADPPRCRYGYGPHGP